jgi:hypothetical protein
MTPTTSVTATQTMTPTSSETPTQTPSPTPTKAPFFAYALIDQAAAAPRNNLSAWMVSNGFSAATGTFKGFNVAGNGNPSTDPATFNAQMNAYMGYPGWGNYNPAPVVTGITSTSGGFDLQNQAITAYKFQTAFVPAGTFSGTSAWVTWFVSTAATNGLTYSTINYGGTAGATTVSNLPGTYTGLTINFTGSSQIPAGVYKMYTSYSFTDLRPLVGNLPQYYRGGTLI